MEQIVSGYPDFQRQFCEKYRNAIDDLDCIERAFDEVFRVPCKESLHKVCRHLAKSIANSFSATLLLCANGFGPDAMKLVRGMFESAVTIMYLTKHPESLSDFMDYHWVVAMKRQRSIEKYAPESLKAIKPEAVEAIKTEYDRVISRFQDANRRIRPRWSKQPLFELAKEVGMDQHYFTVYGFGSALQHGDMSGIGMQLDPDPEVFDVDIAPSFQWVDQAFVSAYSCCILALCEYIDLARPEMQQTKEALITKLESAFRRDDHQNSTA